MHIRRSIPVSLMIGAATLAFVAAAGCSGNESAPEAEITPFSISLTVKDATVEEVTGALADFIHQVDDTGRGLPADWIVAGGDELEGNESPSAAALKLPGGARIVEVCNHHYASMAMSFGGHHAVALPCEIAVTQQGDDVDVVILNPEAIFSLFFQDVPAEHAGELGGLAATVRQELEDLVTAALTDFQVEIRATDVGPSYTQEQIAELAQGGYAITMDMDIPSEYLGSPDDKDAFKALFVETLLETLTHEGMQQVGSSVDGLTVEDWRSARSHALGLPGGVKVVEMCSPTYAAAAMSLGAYHAPALPCQLAVWIDGDTLRVDLLDPAFIFPVFFGDAPVEAMEEMGGLVTAVRGDIQLLVAAAQVALAPAQ